MPTLKSSEPMLPFATMARLDSQEDFERLTKTVVVDDAISEEEYDYLCAILQARYASAVESKPFLKRYWAPWTGVRPLSGANLLSDEGKGVLSSSNLNAVAFLKPGTYHTVIWPYADWERGVFHDGTSCFFNGRTELITSMFGSGASSFLVFSDYLSRQAEKRHHLSPYKPHSRSWVLPIHNTHGGTGQLLTNIYSDSGRDNIAVWQLFLLQHEHRMAKVLLRAPTMEGLTKRDLWYWNQSFYPTMVTGIGPDIKASWGITRWDFSLTRKSSHHYARCEWCDKRVPVQSSLLSHATGERLCKQCAKPCAICGLHMTKEQRKAESLIPEGLSVRLAKDICQPCFTMHYVTCHECGAAERKLHINEEYLHTGYPYHCYQCTTHCFLCNNLYPNRALKVPSQHHLTLFKEGSFPYTLIDYYVKLRNAFLVYHKKTLRDIAPHKISTMGSGMWNWKHFLANGTLIPPTSDIIKDAGALPYYMAGICKTCLKAQPTLPNHHLMTGEYIAKSYQQLRAKIDEKKKQKQVAQPARKTVGVPKGSVMGEQTTYATALHTTTVPFEEARRIFRPEGRP